MERRIETSEKKCRRRTTLLPLMGHIQCDMTSPPNIIVIKDDYYQLLYDAGRHTYIGKVFWDPDGFPNFSVPRTSIAARPEDLFISLEQKQ